MRDMSKMTLYDRLAYQFPYDVETKFPAYIWQTWRWTPAHAEFQFREQEATWTEQHPGFIHEVITDQVAVHLIRLLYASVPEVIEAYDALPLAVLKADFFRYLILLARGGIYSDIDTYAIRSALEWIPEAVPRNAVGLVIGIEADPDRPDWKDWYSRRIQFCQWTIQAKPGHPVLREVVTRITDQTLKRKKAGSLKDINNKSVIEFTGPALWTDVIFEYFNDGRYFDMSQSPGQIDWRNFTGMENSRRVGDVVVLPITSFSPGVQQMGAKDTDDPMAFVRHDFEGMGPLPDVVVYGRLLTCCVYRYMETRERAAHRQLSNSPSHTISDLFSRQLQPVTCFNHSFYKTQHGSALLWRWQAAFISRRHLWQTENHGWGNRQCTRYRGFGKDEAYSLPLMPLYIQGQL
jgi:alpha 1,6-mannosyltransferase